MAEGKKKKTSASKKKTSSVRKTGGSFRPRATAPEPVAEPVMSVARSQQDVKAAVAAQESFGKSASFQVASATGAAGAASILIIYIGTLAHIAIPVEVASAFTTLISFVAGVVTHRKNYSS